MIMTKNENRRNSYRRSRKRKGRRHDQYRTPLLGRSGSGISGQWRNPNNNTKNSYADTAKQHIVNDITTHNKLNEVTISNNDDNNHEGYIEKVSTGSSDRFVMTRKNTPKSIGIVNNKNAVQISIDRTPNTITFRNCNDANKNHHDNNPS